MIKDEREFSVRSICANLAAAVVLVTTGCTSEADPDPGDTGEDEVVEKQFAVDGASMNYAEGPDNGPPLLLIHGQMTDWQTWNRALPTLTQNYHVFAVDCFGHGGSDHVPERYTARALSTAMSRFLTEVVGEPATVVGHSSGGLIAADLAAHSREKVRGVILEDPPLFSSVLPRAEQTWNYVDLSTLAHEFLLSGEADFTAYYLEHTLLWTFFPPDLGEMIKQQALAYRRDHPDEPVVLEGAPPEFNELLRALSSYDPRFGEAFHDNTFHQDFDHADTLSRITVPTVLIHANWSVDDNGVLLGAMSGDEAEQARSLLADVEFVKVDSGHSVHFEKTDEFLQIVLDFEARLQP
ncbi:Pimeloyl-ACP methyl ester carboxylesterase [Nannocystis exedens]|uniref:Pimeloyl-ACP methyl ester carboxylesterase n=1 Tax=Nannocystis exedens TaxID=54 RepID=A0A1I2I0C5_9BACT|nr:alpha/beta hydrolase [Nannocystis exedens]PCC73513.1 Dihydrolipoyllysine-residue acetyltransferase component of acetoin cleaving system [Nannocystis exedens]SFF35744.1 Pimeloyl-ACP methyl ester carboxylesterase [Nannocystis exedens]